MSGYVDQHDLVEEEKLHKILRQEPLRPGFAEALRVEAKLRDKALAIWDANHLSLAEILQMSPQDQICLVFGPYCSEAIAVADCEGDFDPASVNGQYLGTFQMGETERATYGHASTVYGQAQAAYRYFAATDYDWSPWVCKP